MGQMTSRHRKHSTLGTACRLFNTRCQQLACWSLLLRTGRGLSKRHCRIPYQLSSPRMWLHNYSFVRLLTFNSVTHCSCLYAAPRNQTMWRIDQAAPRFGLV